MRRWLWIITVGALGALGVLTVPGSVAAQSDGNGLEEISVNTFHIDSEAGFVRVEVTISLRNVTTDQRDGNVIRQRFFDEYGVVVPAGAESIVAATSGGTVLSGEVVADQWTDAFSLYEFDLARNLFSGESTTITVTYDHRGLPPRSDVPWRANAAYSSFLAFGSGDSGEVTINVVVPSGHDVDQASDLDGFERQADAAFGTVTYTATGVDENFEALFSVSSDMRLVSTPVDVDEASFVIESWPGDEEWTTFTENHLMVGVPGLEELIGSEWPLDEQLAIRETVEPAFAGYAGWFDTQAWEIAVGEELDADTVFHELSHAWFNSDLFAERWLIEGLAEAFAVELVRRDGGDVRQPEPIDPADPNRIPLSEWGSFYFGEDEVEDFGYAGAWFVVDSIIDEIGFDAVREALATGRTVLLYGEPEEPSDLAERPIDWRRAYDLFELVGGSTAVDELFREHVLTADQLGALDDRAEARAAYDTFEGDVAPWSAPLAVRRDMDGWDFDAAAEEMAAAREVVVRRAEVAAVADQAGVTPPDLAAGPFAAAAAGYDEPLGVLDRQLAEGSTLVELQAEIGALADHVGVIMPGLGGERYAGNVEDFGDAVEIGLDQLDALEVVHTAVDTEAGADGLLTRIGLMSNDVAGTLDAASDALASGDTDLARELAADAQAVLDDAEETGRTRALLAAGALVLALLAVVALMIARRRRRSRSGGGAVDRQPSVGQLGGGALDLDEDALAGTRLGGVDHRVDVAAGHPGETARAAGVVERAPALGDVGDPVLELHEDIGAVVDTDPIAGAEVLIDPDAHDGPER